jgi:catalase-peroxidase
MGPKARYVSGNVPADELLWQDPVPSPGYATISAADQDALKKKVLASGLTVPELVRVAWGAASSYRASDKRGGANGARIALAPQKDWAVNDPAEVAKVLKALRTIRADFGEAKISLADLIVLAGAAAVEKAAADAGVKVAVPFAPGRGDATQAQTDVASFALLEPTADAFRNYYDAKRAYRSPTEMLVDRADQLDLTVPEMTVLIGGLRALGANTGGAKHGVFTDEPGVLTNDFFVRLLDMGVEWRKAKQAGLYEGVDRGSGKVRYSATPVDLIFGSNTELRAVAEAYAYADARERFVRDFVRAWSKVMRADRFDL